MKIALCISGHLRNYSSLKYSYISFKKFCNNYGDVDVFVGTWNRLNTRSSWSGNHGLTLESSITTPVTKQEISSFYETDYIHIEDDEFFSSCYSPLRYDIVTNKKYSWDPRGINENNVIHSYRMFYLVNKTNNLKLYREFHDKFKYDIVIRIRPDMFFHDHIYSKFNFNDIKNSNKLFIVKHDPSHKSYYGYCDRFVMGSSEIMDKFSSVVYNISGLFGEPEDILKQAIHKIIEEQDISFISAPEGLVNENGGHNNTFFLR